MIPFKTPVVVLAALLAHSAVAQLITDFESFAEGDAVMFRAPNFSGSTAGKLDISTFNSSAVTNTFPSGNPNAGSAVLAADFQFDPVAAAPVWLRLTTFGSANLPNPTIDFTQQLQFDVYSQDRDIEIALGVRETGTAAAIGADGGSVGGIEWLGGNNTVGKAVAANTWVTLIFNIPSETVAAFAGAANGVLDGTRGTLEHLAIIPKSGNTDYHLFFDNFRVVPVPEPTTVTLGLLGGFGLLASMIRRRASR